MFTLIGSNGVLEVYGDADEHEVGQEGLVEPVGPLVDSDPLAEAFGEVPPRGSRPAHPQQGVDHGVVVHDHVAALARQQVRDRHEPARRDVIPRRTRTPVIPQRANTP